MNKKVPILLTLAGLLTLSGCNFEINHQGNNSSSHFDGANGQDIPSNVTTKNVKFSKESLKENSIIPTSYTFSGVKLEIDDLDIFANAITYEPLLSEKIHLRKKTGFIRNINPIKNLINVNFDNLLGELSLYVTDDYNNKVWQKIDNHNGFHLTKSYNYFAICNMSNHDVSFESINLNYEKCDTTITNQIYNIKNIKEITDQSQAEQLITVSDEPFVNDTKWTNLGYAKDINASLSQTSNRKQSGYDKPTDWAIPYNPNVVVNQNLESYRLVNMSYGDHGNSFRINMLDGSNGPVIYKDAAYTYVEDIAAYVLAFGDMPVNCRYKANEKREAVKDWGRDGRVNYDVYDNNPNGHPFETKLITHREYFNPTVNHDNYYYRYYESDYGASIGNDEPAQIAAGYDDAPYNNGRIGARGALRFVWTQSYTDYAHYSSFTSEIIESYNRNIFYTATHYNDFQQYLNYYGGWSIRFGNTTLGNNWDQYVSYNHLKDSPKVLLTSLENITK